MDIFVFGSNLAGRHGKGAALVARHRWGAVYGQGAGRQGRSYAIPTKDERIVTLPLSKIEAYVKEFLSYAEDHKECTFLLTKIGCGLAGYTEEDISPMFKDAPYNVLKPRGW